MNIKNSLLEIDLQRLVDSSSHVLKAQLIREKYSKMVDQF